MDAYLDTNVAVRLAHGDIRKITKPARQAMNRYHLLISPIVLVELQYMFEIGRIAVPADQTFAHLQAGIDLNICHIPFADVARAACQEAWTRDAFDRLIVAHARYADHSPLLTADTDLPKHYNHVIW